MYAYENVPINVVASQTTSCLINKEDLPPLLKELKVGTKCVYKGKEFTIEFIARDSANNIRAGFIEMQEHWYPIDNVELIYKTKNKMRGDHE